MDCSMPGLTIHHHLPEFTQTHVHWVGDAIQHLILCRPLLLFPSIFPSIRDFSKELVLCIRWPLYWSFSFSISPSDEYSGLISFRMDWLDLLAVQGTLKSLKIYCTVNSNCRFSWHQRMSAKNLIINDQKWQCDLCFLTDTTLHMNELNLKLRKGKVCYLNRYRIYIRVESSNENKLHLHFSNMNQHADDFHYNLQCYKHMYIWCKSYRKLKNFWSS